MKFFDLQRKRFVTDPKYQLRAAMFVVACILPMSLIYPVVILQVFDFFQSQANLDTETAEVFRSGLMWRLIALQSIFVLFILGMTLYLTHKTAGPLYKLRQHIRLILDGKAPGYLGFRKGDAHVEVAQDLNRLIEKLGKGEVKKPSRYQNGVSELQECVNSLEPGAIKEKLEKALVMFKEDA